MGLLLMIVGCIGLGVVSIAVLMFDRRALGRQADTDMPTLIANLARLLGHAEEDEVAPVGLATVVLFDACSVAEDTEDVPDEVRPDEVWPDEVWADVPEELEPAVMVEPTGVPAGVVAVGPRTHAPREGRRPTGCGLPIRPACRPAAWDVIRLH
jgi:hypothetical protein